MMTILVQFTIMTLSRSAVLCEDYLRVLMIVISSFRSKYIII